MIESVLRFYNSVTNKYRAKKYSKHIIVFFSIFILFTTGFYGAIKASHSYATNSDALTYTYLVGDGLNRHQIALPDQHANLIKLPFFYIQSLFPFHHASFMLFSIVLVMITIGGWAYLLIRLFGRKYQVLILILFAATLFTSTQLDLQIALTTVRNIELPISLWFIFIISDLLKNRKFSRKYLYVSVVGFLLYSLVLAGDNYFEYAISLPLILTIGWYWIQTKRFTKYMSKALLVIIAASVVGMIVKILSGVLGIIVLDKGGDFPNTLVTLQNLSPSITTALKQLLNLQGASIFGQTGIHLGLANLSIFINFLFLIISVSGLLLIIFKTNSKILKLKSLTANDNFIYFVVAISYFIILFVYILSGQVAQVLSNGQVSDLGQIRYIAILPFLSIVGLVWIIKTYYRKHTYLISGVILVCLFNIIMSYSSVRQSYINTDNLTQPSQTILKEISSDLNKDNVTEALTGYWYGASLRFWSNNTINFAVISSCNIPFGFNVREDWYKPSDDKLTALVINRPNDGYWNCSDTQLLSIYGNPIKKQLIQGGLPGTYVDIWVYNYDVRDRLAPFPE